MSDVSLQISGSAQRWYTKDRLLEFLSRLGIRFGRWAVVHAEGDLDSILVKLTGFLELSLFFSPEHAAKQLELGTKKLDLTERILNSSLKRSYQNGAPMEYAIPFVQKLQDAIRLVHQIKHRLLLVSLLDLDKIAALDPDLRQEVMEINALRHQKVLEAHPEWRDEIQGEATEWLQADLQPILE